MLADEEDSRTPVLYIKNLDESCIDLETLQLYMSHRKRTEGGEILSWNVQRPKSGGLVSVQVVYKDPVGRLMILFSNVNLILLRCASVYFSFYYLNTPSYRAYITVENPLHYIYSVLLRYFALLRFLC